MDECRSRLGAWIEIFLLGGDGALHPVAPAWERGLKLHIGRKETSRLNVAPAWERGLKCNTDSQYRAYGTVAPAWERGLKSDISFLRESVF